MLAKRLASRGVVLSAVSLAAVVSQNVASAGVPTSLKSSTVKAATMIAAGQAAVAGVVPAKVAALTEGVLKSMMLTKLSKAAVAGLVVLCLCGLGIGGFQGSSAQETKTADKRADEDKKATTSKHGIEELQGVWQLIGMEAEGQVVPHEQIAATDDEKKRVVIDGKVFSYTTTLGKKDNKIIKIDNTHSPKWIDLISFDESESSLGVYRLEGDELRICLSCDTEQKRPTELATKKGTQDMLLICKRLRVPKDEQEATDKSTTANRAKAIEARKEEQQDTATKHGIEELEGTWVRPRSTLVIEGNRWSDSNERATMSGLLKLVDVASAIAGAAEFGIPPMSGTLKLVAVHGDVLHVDLLVTKGIQKGLTIKCIFRRKGNTLHCCYNDMAIVDSAWNGSTGPRPTEFKSAGDNILDVYQLQPEEETAGTGEEAIKREKATQKVVDAIQGEWVVEKTQFGPETDELKGRKATINGCMLTFSVRGDEQVKGMTFKVNPAKNPATIDFFDEKKRLVSKGRFVLDGDKLTLCVGLTAFRNDGEGEKVSAGERPTKLDPSEGVLFILKRPK
jgi:uncharacterized protein (TIGR03067 family)